MKRLLIVVPLLLLDGIARADMASYSTAMPRHDITNMTCDEVHSVLQSEGKAIMRWHSSKGMPRWGKYVAGPWKCSMQQIPGKARLSTSDTKSCVVTVCNGYGRSANRM
jgi:hypothetical protein